VGECRAEVEALVANGMESADAKRTHQRYVARLKRAWETGVTIVFGTDIMSDTKERTRGQMALGYIDSFVEAGVNPLRDINGLKRIDFVMKDGQVYRRP